MKTTMNKLANGAVFQFGHDSSPDRPCWIKRSNRYAVREDPHNPGCPDRSAPTPTENFSAWTSDVCAEIEPVTYMGRREV